MSVMTNIQRATRRLWILIFKKPFVLPWPSSGRSLQSSRCVQDL